MLWGSDHTINTQEVHRPTENKGTSSCCEESLGLLSQASESSLPVRHLPTAKWDLRLGCWLRQEKACKHEFLSSTPGTYIFKGKVR